MNCTEEEEESAKRFELAIRQLQPIYNSDGSKMLRLRELTKDEIDSIRIKSYTKLKI